MISASLTIERQAFKPLERYIPLIQEHRVSEDRLEAMVMMSEHNSSHPHQAWFDRGKEDAWSGKSKQPPEHDPQAASFYDLGYSEGEIERPPTSKPSVEQDDRQSIQ